MSIFKCNFSMQIADRWKLMYTAVSYNFFLYMKPFRENLKRKFLILLILICCRKFAAICRKIVTSCPPTWSTHDAVSDESRLSSYRNTVTVLRARCAAHTNVWRVISLIYTVSQKNSQNCFRQNFVKFPPTLIIFGKKMAKTIELCKVHSFSTSPNFVNALPCKNTDVPNCYTTLCCCLR